MNIALLVRVAQVCVAQDQKYYVLSEAWGRNTAFFQTPGYPEIIITNRWIYLINHKMPKKEIHNTKSMKNRGTYMGLWVD